MGKVIEPHHELATIYRLCIAQLNRGIQNKNHPFREVAFATSGEAPNVRMVILRKVEQDPFRVSIYTDYRSEKVGELKSNTLGTFLFWHPKSNFQLKLKTRVHIHHQNNLTVRTYESLSKISKRSYNALESSGSLINAESDPKVVYRASFTAEDFALLSCEVYQMEALQLSRQGHIRAAFDIDGGKNSFIVP